MRDIDSAGVMQGYTSMDFEFVAFVLTHQNPKVKVVGLIPVRDTGQRTNRGTRYMFVLLPIVDGDGNSDPDWYEKLEQLSLAYVNRETLAEPTALAQKRKSLRGLIIDAPKVHERGIRIIKPKEA